MRFKSVDDLLDFAIGREEEAYAFYMELAGRVQSGDMKAVFEGFAREEAGHKTKLQGVRAGKRLLPAEGKVQDLKIADYLVDVAPVPSMDYQEALILAMKNEKAAFRLYSDLAAATDDAGLKVTLSALAQEEAKHKLRFELEYDEQILKEN